MTGQDRGRLRVVLVAARNPLNIGAAARAMANFGFCTLRLAGAYDVAFREARSAVGAGRVMQAAEVYASVAEAVADCSLVVGTTSIGHRALDHPLRRLEHGARLMRRHLASGNAALLFGSEKFGLTNEDLSHCHWLVRIATVDQEHSMNLGQSVAVCLHELVRSPAAARVRPGELTPAAAEETERITEMLLDALRQSGYVNPVVEGSTEEKVRRLVRRMKLSARDAPVLMGMLRQILWKLGSGTT